MENLNAFLSRKKIGLILRVYAQEESQIPKRVKMIREFIERVLTVKHRDRVIVSRIDVLVWADKRFKESDCGKTAQALRDIFPRKTGSCVHIQNVEYGDLFCGLLNYGIAIQSRAGIEHSIIASSEAYSYFNEATLMAMIEAAKKGARAVGVAINELTDSILKGRLANTFCMWDNISLMAVGGFDFRASKPTDEKTAHYMRGWHEDNGDVYYHLAGVEEVVPLARMVELFGECLAPVLPQGEGVKRYEAPNPATETELYLRHTQKMGTKLERQTAHLVSIGCDPSVIEGGIMPEYRNS